MKYVLIAILFSVSVRGWSQTNLVPNWSFEEFNSCQTLPTPFGSNINYTLYWFSPFSIPGSGTGGGVELFATCSEYPLNSVPHTAAGYQQPYDGQNFAGVFHYYDEFREYIEVGLTDALQAGKKYCLRFRYAYGDSSTHISDGLGAYFSNDSLRQIDSNLFGSLPVIPQVSQPDNFLIVDTANWLLFIDTFVVQGGERYVTIGNFKYPNYLVQIRPVPDNLPPNCYMFIDAVEVFYCDTIDTVPPPEPQYVLKFYPNPSDASFTLSLPDSSSTITVFDVIGRIVYTSLVLSHSVNVSTAYWSSGVYVLQVRSESVNATKKFVVQH